MRIGNLVQPGIFMCINDGFFHQLYTNHFFGGITQKNTNAARTAIKIIDRLCAIQQCKILGKLVKPFSLTGIGLKKRFGTDAEKTLTQLFSGKWSTMVKNGFLVLKAVIEFSVDGIVKRADGRKLCL